MKFKVFDNLFLRLLRCVPGGRVGGDICPLGALRHFGLLLGGRHGHDGSDGVALAEVDDPHALRSAARKADLLDGGADREARAVDDHQVVLVRDGLDRNELAGLLGDVDRLDALAAAVGDAVLVEVGALTVAVLAQHQDVALVVGLDADHADDLVVALQRDAPHAGADTSDRTHRGLVEADGLALAGGDHHLGGAARELGLDQLVALADDDGVDAVLARPRLSIKVLANLSSNEPFFRGHFPNNPVMPGVLIIESMVQASRALFTDQNQQINLSKIRKARFRKMVKPGDQLIIEIVKKDSTQNIFGAKAFVEDKLACSADLIFN